jgi:hypothetical protein
LKEEAKVKMMDHEDVNGKISKSLNSLTSPHHGSRCTPTGFKAMWVLQPILS